jgi:DNA-binding transcriptional MerR regulator
VKRAESKFTEPYVSVAPLLVSREQACRMLGGLTPQTLHRYELQGRIKPIRFTKTKRGMVFYRVEDVTRLVEEAEANG